MRKKKMMAEKMTAKAIEEYERSRDIYRARSSGKEVLFPLENNKSETAISVFRNIKKTLTPRKVYSDAELEKLAIRESALERLRKLEVERREDVANMRKERERLQREHGLERFINKEGACSEEFSVRNSFWMHGHPKASEQVMRENKMMAEKKDYHELSGEQYRAMSSGQEISFSSENNNKIENILLSNTTVKSILTPQKAKAHKETYEQKEKKLKKIFVGNLSCNTKEEELISYFCPYEEILNCSIARNPVTHESRCYGYVEFQHLVPVSKVLGPVHAIRDYIITVHAVEKDVPEPEEFCKIFVRNIHPTINYRDFYLHFSKFGNIKDYKLTSSKGYAFIQFYECNMMYKALDAPSHIIKDKSVTVEKFVEPEYPEHHRKIKVQHLNSCTTEDTLIDYFKQYGKILSCGVINDNNTPELLCFAFLIFEKASSISKISLTKSHLIDNKCVTIELPKKINLINEEYRKVYIEDVPFYVKIGTLYEYFEEIGPVISCVINKNIFTGESEGCGYVIFQDSKDAASCARSRKHPIYSEGYGTHEIICYQRKQIQPEHLRTIKVLHLNACTTEYKLNEYFNYYGKVVRCRITKEKNANELIYSAHLIFEKASTIKKIPLTTPHLIDNKCVTIELPKKPNFETSNKNYSMNRNTLRKACPNSYEDCRPKTSKLAANQVPSLKSTEATPRASNLSLNQQMQKNWELTETPRVENLSLNQQMQRSWEPIKIPRVKDLSPRQQMQWNAVLHPISEAYWDIELVE